MQIKHRYTDAILWSDDCHNIADSLTAAVKAGVILTDANLERANLYGAYLAGANLYGADLTSANLERANLPPWRHVPESGTFRAYKAVKSDAGPAVLLVQIDADTPRINGIGSHKCRAERVLVLEQVYGEPATEFVSPTHRDKLTYRVGEYTVADKYVDDYRLECTSGIHFFMTMQEAIDWSQR